MDNNLRFELSFKNIPQLENKLNYCLSNNIKKINIPCKGIIKKELLNDAIEFIGENYEELDVVYHYSLYHQYNRNRQTSYLDFISFIKKCISYKNKEILLVSGSNKKKNFEVLDVLRDFRKETNFNINIGVAYNPYLRNYFDISGERLRFEEKISSGLSNSIWLQFGTDIKLLESEINYLKDTFLNDFSSRNDHNVQFFGSLLIPSKQFISRFKFRPWKGVYIANEYINSLKSFTEFTKDLIRFYLDNNICPVIETEFFPLSKLKEINDLLER